MATSPTLLAPYPLEDYDGGRASSLTRSQDGYEGTRYAMVLAADEGEALTAPGLPNVGDRWSDLVPGAIVQRVGPAQFFGGTDASNLRKWVVPIEYGAAQWGGAGSNPRYRMPGDAITELVTGVEQQTVYQPVTQFGTFWRKEVDADGAEIISTPPQSPIANGEGTNIEIGTLFANVSVWYEPNAAVNISRLTSLSRPSKVNQYATTLPPIEFTSARIPMRIGQVRYRTFSYAIELSGRNALDGSPTPLLRVTHSLSLAESHEYVWQATDAAGEPVATYYRDRLYRLADFGGLWE